LNENGENVGRWSRDPNRDVHYEYHIHSKTSDTLHPLRLFEIEQDFQKLLAGMDDEIVEDRRHEQELAKRIEEWVGPRWIFNADGTLTGYLVGKATRPRMTGVNFADNLSEIKLLEERQPSDDVAKTRLELIQEMRIKRNSAGEVPTRTPNYKKQDEEDPDNAPHEPEWVKPIRSLRQAWNDKLRIAFFKSYDMERELAMAEFLNSLQEAHAGMHQDEAFKEWFSNLILDHLQDADLPSKPKCSAEMRGCRFQPKKSINGDEPQLPMATFDRDGNETGPDGEAIERTEQEGHDWEFDVPFKLKNHFTSAKVEDILRDLYRHERDLGVTRETIDRNSSKFRKSLNLITVEIFNPANMAKIAEIEGRGRTAKAISGEQGRFREDISMTQENKRFADFDLSLLTVEQLEKIQQKGGVWAIVPREHPNQHARLELVSRGLHDDRESEIGWRMALLVQRLEDEARDKACARTAEKAWPRRQPVVIDGVRMSEVAIRNVDLTRNLIAAIAAARELEPGIAFADFGDPGAPAYSVNGDSAITMPMSRIIEELGRRSVDAANLVPAGSDDAQAGLDQV